MHIAFDGTTIRPGRTGVGYYSEHLLRHLVSRADSDAITVISNRPIDTAISLPPSVRTHVSAGWAPRLVWMQAHAPRLLRRLQADVVHFTNGMAPMALSVPTVVTIHDMSLTMYPRFHPPRRVALNRPFVSVAARRADAIITVSETARRDIVRLFGIDERRVHVVHEAAAPAFRPVRDAAVLHDVRERYGLADRFVLYVGTIEPRKNLPLLLEAFARRRRAGDLPHQLVCVGPYGWLSRDVDNQIDRLGVRDAVRFTGYVPFADLPSFYSLAEMFVFPSVYEGFGLPAIEAMACGCPVVVGAAAALAEVGGDAVHRVDPLSADSLGDVLVSLARDRDRRKAMSQRGLRRAEMFSWDRTAAETLDVYRRVLAAPVGAREALPAVLRS